MKADGDGLSYYLISDTKTHVLGVAHVHPSFKGRIHTHKEPERYLLLKGQGILFLDGRTSVLREGDVKHIPGNSAHAFVSTGDTAVLMFEFDSGPLSSIEYTYTGQNIRS